MIPRIVLLSVVFAIAGAVVAAEEAPVAPSAHDILRAQLAAQAKAKAEGKPTGPLQTPVLPAPEPAGDTNPLLARPAPAATTSTSSTPAAKAEPATVLPKVEVRKDRITKLDQQLAKQDQDIAREKKNTKPSELDKALNDDKIAKPLAIFGGESTQYRKQVASERVSLMEDEKDLIEAIAHAKTKEEKAELQKQLDFVRQERRELEQSLR